MKSPIYVIYDSPYESGGQVCAGDEGKDFPDREDTYYGFKFYGVFKKCPNGAFYQKVFDSDLKVGQKAYCVVVRYSDGDTFGCSDGNACIAACVGNLGEASEIKTSIKKDTFKGYKPWNGYFAKLSVIEIEVSEVQEEM